MTDSGKVPREFVAFNGTTYQEVASLHLGAGELFLLRINWPLDDPYENPFPPDETHVVFMDDRNAHLIEDGKGLLTMAEIMDVTLPDEVQGKEENFAIILGNLLNAGKVLVTSRHHGEVKEVYAIEPDLRPPRLAEDRFHFLVWSATWDDPLPPVHEIIVDLTTMEHETRPIASTRNALDQGFDQQS